MKFLLILFLFIYSLKALSQRTIFLPQAKFQAGNLANWKDPEFNDSSWNSIKTTEKWEKQGYDNYDGYAWYRIKFLLPSSLKNNAYWKDSLSFFLSRIDDADETFLNGIKIGKTGSFSTDPGGAVGLWDVYRFYNIAVNCIQPALHLMNNILISVCGAF